MSCRWLCLVVSLGVAQCRTSDEPSSDNSTPTGIRMIQTGAEAASDSGAAPQGDGDAGTPSPSATFPADWCSRLGAMDGLPTVLDVVYEYVIAQEMYCETAGLTSALTDEQYCDWLTYLTNYTFLMAGCVPNFEVVEGGIRVLGPANTPFVGAERSPLTPAEASLLIDYYVEAFASALALTPEERDAVRAYLLQVANPEIDSAAMGTLSTCAAPDAGQ